MNQNTKKKFKKRVQRKKGTDLYTWMGWFDEDDNYIEKYGISIARSKLPQDALSMMREKHDITIKLVPSCEVVVFARNDRALNTYKETMGEGYLKSLLESFSKYGNAGEALWTNFDFPA